MSKGRITNSQAMIDTSIGMMVPDAYMAGVGPHKGMIEKGNIKVAPNRMKPLVRNPDGSISSVRSVTITGQGGRAYVIPTVVKVGGRWQVVSDREAIRHFQKTGQHLGLFRNERQANAYAVYLHNWLASYEPQSAYRRR